MIALLQRQVEFGESDGRRVALGGGCGGLGLTPATEAREGQAAQGFGGRVLDLESVVPAHALLVGDVTRQRACRPCQLVAASGWHSDRAG